METMIALPDVIPVMTLPDTVFFPHALLPLHIFEPRYRQMLRDVLVSHRIFAVARLNEDPNAGPAQLEPPHRVATAGIIRACQKDASGMSNLILQGMCRVEFLDITAEAPYRHARIRPLASNPGAAAAENRRLRRRLGRLLAARQRLRPSLSDKLSRFLQTVTDPETFVDLAAFGLCDDSAVKQQLLETLDLHRRLGLFATAVKVEIDTLRLHEQLRDFLGDAPVGAN